MRLGILGGTFNPIHIGHLLLAQRACEALRLDRVMFIPTGSPPHKSALGLISGAIRAKLVKLAIRTNPAFRVSDVELKRQGVSYSIDTLRLLRKRYPKAKLFLLVGEDMLDVRWKSWDEITKLCTVVVAPRKDSKRRKKNRRIKWLDMPHIGISSSDIRSRLRANQSIRYLVPSSVERYIREHRLYL